MLLITVASVINPTLKLEWIKDHWSSKEAKSAEEWIRGSVSRLPYKLLTSPETNHC